MQRQRRTLYHAGDAAVEGGAACSCHPRTGHDARHGEHVRGLRWQGCVARKQAVMSAAAPAPHHAVAPHAALEPCRLCWRTSSCKTRRKCGAAAAPKAAQGGQALIHSLLLLTWKRGMSRGKCAQDGSSARVLPLPAQASAAAKQNRKAAVPTAAHLSAMYARQRAAAPASSSASSSAAAATCPNASFARAYSPGRGAGV